MKHHCIIVGCGRMGAVFADVCGRLSLDVLTLVDSNLEAARNLKSASKSACNSTCFDSISAIKPISSGAVAAVATTADHHISIAMKLIEVGVRKIVVEKPVGTSLRSCSDLLELSTRHGCLIAVNHQMRYLPQYLVPRALMAGTDYGAFSSMNVLAGNFGLAMNAIHYFEAFRCISGDNPVEVSALFDDQMTANPRGPQFQDVSGCVRVTTASGKRLYIDASADQGHGLQVTYMARNGRITVDELTGAMTTVVRSAEHREAPTNRYGMPVEIQQHQIPPVELVESTKAVLQALLAGEGYPTLADATLAVKTLVAAYHSHRQGGVPVRLADIADDDPEVFPWA